MASADSPGGLTDQEVVNAVRELVLPGEQARDIRNRRFDQNYETYRAKPNKRDKDVPAWRARTRIPYAQYTIDTEVVGITAGVPRCMVHPRRAQDVLAARAMQHVMDHYIGEDHLVEKQPVVAQQSLVYGVTGGKNTWGYQEQARPQRLYLPDTAGRLQLVTQDARVVVRDGPCFDPWDVYQMVWDPNGRDVDSCRYVILYSWVTKDYLLENEFNPATGEGLYRNVGQLLETASPAYIAKAQDNFYSGPNQKKVGMFLIEEVWTDDTLVVIGNRKVLLRATGNPYWHGKKPVVLAQTRPDMFEIQGVPEVDMVSDIQGTMQTLQNMILDALKLTVLRGVTYREGSAVDPAMLNLRPNFKWGVTDHDDVRAFEVPQLGSDVYNMLSSLLGDMERVTGVSAYLTGSDSSTINQTTATGVTALQSAANTQLKFKAMQLRNRIFQRTYEQWGDLTQQYLSNDLEIEITGPPEAGMNVLEHNPETNKTWIQVPPEQVQGHLRFRLEGSEESISRQQERAEALQLLNAIAPFAQLPGSPVNMGKLLERVAAAFDIMPPESILQPPPPQQALPPAAPFGQQGQAGMGQPPLMNGQQLPAVVQQAVTGR